MSIYTVQPGARMLWCLRRRTTDVRCILYPNGMPVEVQVLQDRDVVLTELFQEEWLALNWAQEHADAILAAWYPGQSGGTAIAHALAGDFNPGGRLPVTFYRSTKDLPAYVSYDMKGRTYRYFTGTPLYPFGLGLSYTTFA